MKGVILAGGTGSRLFPLTACTNKQLLPVYNKPMIFYPLQTLIDMGINEIMIVTGVEHCGQVSQLLGSGRNLGVNITYRIQDKAGGIAEALSLAESFVGKKETVAVILGDNIFEDQFDVSDFQKGARLFLKAVDDPERFGVADVVDNKIVGIEEKPKSPKSNFAVTGLYVYDSWVFEFIQTLQPSSRNELEITDVNNKYVDRGLADCEFVRGYWTDAGTFESLYRANTIARDIELEKLDEQA